MQSTKIPGTDIAFSATIYKIPQSTSRPTLPIARHKKPVMFPMAHPTTSSHQQLQRTLMDGLVQKRHHPSSQLQTATSPVKRIKMDRVEQEQFSHMVGDLLDIPNPHSDMVGDIRSKIWISDLIPHCPSPTLTTPSPPIASAAAATQR